MKNIRSLKPVRLNTVEISTVVSAFYTAIVSDFRDTFASYCYGNMHDDRRILLRRCREEGLPFCQTVMPGLGRALNTAMVEGIFVCPHTFRCVTGTKLPKLFYKIWTIAFTDDGLLRVPDTTEASVNQRVAIRALRQVTLAFSKVEVSPSSESIERSIEAFVQRTSADAYLDLYDALGPSDGSGWESRFQMNAMKHRGRLIAQASRLVDHLFRAGNAWDRICPVIQGPALKCEANSDPMGQVLSSKA